jgi:hypothetical protein
MELINHKNAETYAITQRTSKIIFFKLFFMKVCKIDLFLFIYAFNILYTYM